MRAAIPVAVGVLMAVVAVASHTEATGAAPTVRSVGMASPISLLLALVGAGLVAVSVAAAVALRDSRPRLRRPAWQRLGRAAAGGVGVVALLLFGRLVTGELERPPAPAVDEAPDQRSILPADDGEPLTAPAGAAAALVIIGGMAALAVLIIVRRRQRHPEASDQDLREVLQRGIDDLRAATDARAAVVSAYARLEASLQATGHGRLPQETTVEYVERILDRTHLPTDALVTLGRLYQHARYADAPIDRSMQHDAIEALVAARDAVQSPTMADAVGAA